MGKAHLTHSQKELSGSEMILSLNEAGILHNDLSLGYWAFVVMEWISEFFNIMSDCNIGYQLIKPYHQEQAWEVTSSISIPLDPINV